MSGSVFSGSLTLGNIMGDVLDLEQDLVRAIGRRPGAVRLVDEVFTDVRVTVR